MSHDLGSDFDGWMDITADASVSDTTATLSGRTTPVSGDHLSENPLVKAEDVEKNTNTIILPLIPKRNPSNQCWKHQNPDLWSQLQGAGTAGINAKVSEYCCDWRLDEDCSQGVISTENAQTVDPGRMQVLQSGQDITKANSKRFYRKDCRSLTFVVSSVCDASGEKVQSTVRLLRDPPMSLKAYHIIWDQTSKDDARITSLDNCAWEKRGKVDYVSLTSTGRTFDAFDLVYNDEPMLLSLLGKTVVFDLMSGTELHDLCMSAKKGISIEQRFKSLIWILNPEPSTGTFKFSNETATAETGRQKLETMCRNMAKMACISYPFYTRGGYIVVGSEFIDEVDFGLDSGADVEEEIRKSFEKGLEGTYFGGGRNGGSPALTFKTFAQATRQQLTPSSRGLEAVPVRKRA